MSTSPTAADISCPHCGSARATRAGRRRLKDGSVRQFFHCADCLRRFSHCNRTGRRTDPIEGEGVFASHY
jgi:transposase-like protein